MKEWFIFRFGGITGASVGVYYVLNYILVLYVPALNLPVYTWMAVSMVWVIGLIIVRWQFNNFAEGDTSKKEKWDFRRFLNQERNRENFGNERTVLEQAQGERLNPDVQPGPNEIREMGTKKNELGLTNIVEGIVGNSLAEAELSLDLELPGGTELMVHGQKYTVKKGNVKIRPKKSQSEKLKEMFPSQKTRKRVG